MADKYNAQRLTAHYVAMAQNDPERFGDIRREILGKFQEWRREHTVEVGPDARKDPEVETAVASVNAWFEQIEKTAKLRSQGQPEKAQKTFTNACGKLNLAIRQTDDKLKKESTDTIEILLEDEPFPYSAYLQEVYTPEGEEEKVEFQGAEVLREFIVAPAASYIKDIQDKIKGGADMTARDIATVIAARQIANSVPGSSARLQSTKIDPTTLKERTDALLNSEPFQEFLSDREDPRRKGRYNIDPRLLTGGHGGELEADFAASVRSREDLSELPRELFGRYQVPQEEAYNSYHDFLLFNQNDYLENGGKIKSVDKKIAEHAARMLTAYQMYQKDRAYNQRQFDRNTAQVYNSPEFQFMLKHDPAALNLLTTGRFGDYGEKLNGILEGSKEADAGKPARIQQRTQNLAELTDCMQTGKPYGTQQQRKNLEAYKQGQKDFAENYRFLGSKKGEIPAAIRKMQAVANGIHLVRGEVPDPAPIVQDKTLDRQHGMDLLRSVSSLVQDWENTNPTNKSDRKVLLEFSEVTRLAREYQQDSVGKDGTQKKTAQVKAQELKALQNAVLKFTDTYTTESKKDYAAQRKAYEKENAKLAAPMRTADKKSVEAKKPENYLANRGPKYNAMMDAALEYQEGYDPEKGGVADPSKALKVVNAVLDYQKGKEKFIKGEDGERFNNSMSLLAQVTAGTSLEKYLDEQIAHVNKVRGAKQGDRNFITKADYLEPFKPEQPAAQHEQDKPVQGMQVQG